MSKELVFEFEHFYHAVQALIEVENTCSKEKVKQLHYFAANNKHYVVAKIDSNSRETERQMARIFTKTKGLLKPMTLQDCLTCSYLKILKNAGKVVKKIYGSSVGH